MKLLMCVVFLLVGCNNGSFSSSDVTEDGGGAASMNEDAGVVSSGSGGSPGAGGHPSTGGAPGTGGTPDTGTGGRVSTGGSAVIETGDACVPVTHSNGTGQIWHDCAPVGTYNERQATKACEAWCAANNCESPCWSAGSVCDGNYILGQVTHLSPMFGWSWTGTTTNVDPIQLSCTVIGAWR